MEDDGSGRLPSAGRFFDADVEVELEEIAELFFVLDTVEVNSGLGAAICVILEELAAALDADTDRALSTRRTLDGPGVGSSTLRLEVTDAFLEVCHPGIEADFEAGRATGLGLEATDGAPLDDDALTDVEVLARADVVFAGDPMGVIATRGYALLTTVGPVGTQTSPPPISSVRFGFGFTTRYCEALA